MQLDYLESKARIVLRFTETDIGKDAGYCNCLPSQDLVVKGGPIGTEQVPMRRFDQIRQLDALRG